MNDDELKGKVKTKDILLEIDNLKKCVTNISNSINSEKLESFVDSMDKNITKLQDETENYYNNKYNKVVETDTK